VDGIHPWEGFQDMYKTTIYFMKSSLALLAAILAFAGSSAQAQDADKGKQVFKKCRVCHMVGEKAKNRVGPPLNNIVGRNAASAEKFKYSPAMKAAATAGLIWTEETLDQYLTNPRKMVPRTRMAFPGIPKPEDRKNLIAYLMAASPAQ
jgi:cytochrome c